MERSRGGRGRGNVGQGSLVTPPALAQQQKEQFISQMEQLSVKVGMPKINKARLLFLSGDYTLQLMLM